MPSKDGKSLSTLENHSVPPFYACYVLRSKKNGKFGQRTYVGSTPDPPRRIRQHNGELTQGAVKTRFFRPWEMEAIVYGFPSKLAALQFEWAWQKAETSRHLRRPAPTERKKTEPPVSYFPTKAHNGTPMSKVSILQRLIVSLPFSRLTLSVMFFSEEAQHWWDTCPATASKPLTAAQLASQEAERAGQPVKERVTKPSLKTIVAQMEEVKLGEMGFGQVSKPDVTHVQRDLRVIGVDGGRLYRNTGVPMPHPPGRAPMCVDDEPWTEMHLTKWESLVEATPEATCHICKEAVDLNKHLSYALCSASSDCSAVTHLDCLGKHFLSHEASTSSSVPPLVPDKGTCPSCNTQHRWGEIVRGVYRRNVHAEDGGKGRRARKRRELAREKMRAIDDSIRTGIPVPEPEKKAPAKKGRKAKAIASSSSDGSEEEDAEQLEAPKKRGRPKKDSSKAADTASNQTEGVTSKAAGKKGATGKKKAPLEYMEMSDSDSDGGSSSELSILRGNEDQDDAEASDEERRLAFDAAANGSLEMQTLDDPDSGLGSTPSSPSTTTSGMVEQARASASPTKKRKTGTSRVSVQRGESDSEGDLPDLQLGRITDSCVAPAAAGPVSARAKAVRKSPVRTSVVRRPAIVSHKAAPIRPVEVFEISDSE